MSILRPYMKLFYIRRSQPTPTSFWIKPVPPNIEELLSPTAMTYWYMDDSDQKWKG